MNKAAPNPLTEAGIQAFAGELEAWLGRISDSLGVRPDGTVDIPLARAQLQEILEARLASALDASIYSAAAQVDASADLIQPDTTMQFLRQYTVNISGDITDNLRSELTDAVRAGIESGRGVSEVAQMIRELLPEQAAYRADRIARSEVAFVEGQGSLLAWGQLDVEGKEWALSPDACSVCIAFFSTYASAPVPLRHVYLSGGVMIVGADGKKYTTWRPVTSNPLHPNCRCALLPVRRIGEQ